MNATGELDGSITTDVLIAGAGPVGLTMAAELLRHGLSCRIVDKLPVHTQVSKASVIHVRNQELLARVGVLEQVRSVGHPMRVSNVHVFGKQIGTLDFTIPARGSSGSDTPFPEPWIIFQRDFEKLLVDHVEARGLPVERPVEVTAFEQDADGVTATLSHDDGRTETHRSRWLIGADGSRSRVRDLAGIEYDGKAYDIDFEFQLGDVTMKTSGLADDEGAIYLTRAGAIVLVIPQYDGTRIVVSHPRRAGESHQDYSSEAVSHGMTGEAITIGDLEALTRRHALRDAELSDELWLSKYRVHSRLATRFRERRVFLVGDAAHIHVPLGGQGMNTGIGDVLNLGWKLALVTRGLGHPELLDTYTAERRPVAQMVVEGTDKLFTRASKPNLLFKLFAPLVAPRVFNRPETQARIRDTMAQLVVRYPFSPIVEDARPEAHEGPPAGNRAPDASLQVAATGKTTSVFGVTQTDPRSSLLVFTGPSPDQATLRATLEAAEAAGRGREDRVAVHVVAARDHAVDAGDRATPVLLDHEGEAHRRYGATGPCFYLIRPDGYVGFAGQPVEPAALDRHLAGLFA